MARNQHVSSIPPRRQWLLPDEATEVAARWDAQRAHDLALSERVGRELLRWLGLVLVALGFVGCAPEGPACEIKPQPGLTRAWCPDTLPTVRVVVAAGCPIEAVREAADHWAPLTDGWTVEVGTVPAEGSERYGEIYISRGDLSAFGDDRIGNTHHFRRGRAMEHARVTVEDCSNVQVIAHEIGHALGYSHSGNVHDLMADPLEAGSWDVPESMFGAMDRAQGVSE